MSKGRVLLEQGHTFAQRFLHGSPIYLREGLIRTYPIGKVIESLSKVFNLSTDEDELERIISGESVYDGFIFRSKGSNGCVQISTVIPNNRRNIENLGRYLNKYGYFYGGGKHEITGTEWVQVWWEKKFDEDATEIVHSLGKIYHLCSERAYRRISKQGLTPRASQWKDFVNPERVYFFLYKQDMRALKYYSEDFNNGKTKSSNRYYLLEIDISKVSEGMKFYYDSRLPEAVYSLEGVSPAAIKIVEEINV